MGYENPSMATEDSKEKVEERIGGEIGCFKKAVLSVFGKEDAEKIEDVEDDEKRKDVSKIFDALEFMLEVHAQQEDRLDGRPYAAHPLEVADDLVNKYGIRDADLIVGALLHDAIEDQTERVAGEDPEMSDSQPAGKEESRRRAFGKIADRYGDRVEKILKGLTNPDFEELILATIPREAEEEKRRLYKEHIAEAIRDSDVFTVKMADFLRNAGNIRHTGERKEYYRKKYGPVIREVFIPVLRDMDGSHPLYGIRESVLGKLERLYEEDYREEGS